MPEPKKSNVSKGTTTTVPAKSTTRTVPAKEKKTRILQERPIKYPYYNVLICCNNVPTHKDKKGNPVEYDGPLTADIAKQLLEWETEPEYVKRRLTEDPELKESKLKFGDEFLLKDADGNKVMCWANCMNRELVMSQAKKYAQDILTKNWFVNCENIIIGCTGLVISGQHRLVGLILAVDEWKRQQHWQEVWDTEPVLETFVAFGCSEEAKVIRTIDNVRPRSLGDVFYTSPLFANKSQHDRAEMSRMMSFAVDLLWKRTRGDKDAFVTDMSHSAAIEFQERHAKLLDCVKHIYDEDGGKPPVKDTETEEVEEITGKVISSGLRIQRGHAAALMYLMGQSATREAAVDEYYAPGANKSEKRLDWKHWDLACKFWSELAAQELEWAQTVKDAIIALNTTMEGTIGTVAITGSNREKWAVITNAWTKYRLKERFENDKPEMLHPEFTIDVDNNRRKITPANEPVIGGIDLGMMDEEDTTSLSKEEIEKKKEEARVEKINKKLNEGKKNTVTADAGKKTVPNKEATPPSGNGMGRDANNKPIGKTPAKKPTKKPAEALRGGTSNEPY
jgi:hypothetical protein